MRLRKDGGARACDPRIVTSLNLPDSLVSDVLAALPGAERVFLDRGMGCVGCTFARFETVAEAARAYGVEPAALVQSLLDVAGAEGSAEPAGEP